MHVYLSRKARAVLVTCLARGWETVRVFTDRVRSAVLQLGRRAGPVFASAVAASRSMARAAVTRAVPLYARAAELGRQLKSRLALALGRLPRRAWWALAACVLAGGVVLAAVPLLPVRPGEKQRQVVVLPRGATTREIARILEERGLIRSGAAFVFVARVRGVDHMLRAGEYSLGPGMSTPDIVAQLVEGRVVHYPVTIPEGWTVRQVVDLLVARGLVEREAFWQTLREEEFPYEFVGDARQKGEVPLEGYLFPDTYLVPRGISEKQLVEVMLRRFDAVMTPEFRERAKQLKMSIHEVVTLASIIEKEARIPAERPLISAVFHNRMRMGIALQSCATVQYVLGWTKEVLTEKDLLVPSSYNTYLHPGLPPGPISNPGRASLEAALYPAQVNYLYFVANRDGTHTFSRTLRDHVQAQRATSR